ncbi:3-phenylpropionate/cinnamic acid dioxygenase subunit beta [Geodia barretti]|uniref:3-phenylpropionate/cinnamic acid dioxygenase subunit beta n=1 Tax=Geodia barretti TaxID=519541 RepID=A0AA35T9A5_GEOBA|nr:3-phenylpropionate/cinnamic acid dioxygenase subunit beta [Geodia barretti]
MTEPNLQEIEQFLYREARLLDNRQFHQWLELLAEDVRYWMPCGHPVTRPSDPRDLTEPDELVVIDEDMDSLRRRIERLDSGFAWAEDPPSRTRHFISNVELESTESPDEVKVYSNFIMYRTRGEREEDFYVGSREDILRRSEKGWLIAYRRIILDQTVISAKNVSNFF